MPTYIDLLESQNPILIAQPDGVGYSDMRSESPLAFSAGILDVVYSWVAFKNTEMPYMARCNTDQDVTLPSFPTSFSGNDITISMYIFRPSAGNGMMPLSIGAGLIDVYATGGYFGINTWASDCHGFPESLITDNKWHHVVFTATTTDVNGTIRAWLDGVEQPITHLYSTVGQSRSITGSNTLQLHGGVSSASAVGYIDTQSRIGNVTIFDRILTPEEITAQANYIVGSEVDPLATKVFAKNPTAYWKFYQNETTNKVADVTKNRYELHWTGTFDSSNETLPFDSHAQGGSYDTLGTSYAKTVATSNDFNPNLHSDWTMECWVKLLVPQTTEYGSIMGFHRADGNYFDVRINSGSFVAMVWTGALLSIGEPIKMATNRLYHLVVTQGTFGRRFYINGALVGETSDLTAASNATDRFQLARTSWNDEYDERLKYYEAAIYMGRSFSTADVLENYETGLTTLDHGEQAYKDLVLGKNPIAYYPCDREAPGETGRLIDETGNGHHLPMVAGSSMTALGLNGSQAYHHQNVTGQSFKSIPVAGLGQTSIEYWAMRTGEGNSTNLDTIGGFCHPDGTGTTWIGWITRKDTGKYMYLATIRGASVEDQTYAYDLEPLNEWNHYVLNCDFQNGKVYGYINGHLCSTRSMGASGALGGDLAISLGARPDTGVYEYNGAIQHIAAYDRMLTEAEIKEHVAQRVPVVETDPYALSVIEDKPISYWKLDDLTGTKITDTMGLNHGTLQGGTCDTMTTTGLNLINPTEPCLTFNGTNQYIDVGHPTLFSTGKAFTCEAIVEWNVGSIRSIFGFMQVGGFVFRLNASGYIETRMRTTSNNATYENVDSTYTLKQGQIAHVATTFDGRYVKVYINGRFAAERDWGTDNDTLDQSEWNKGVIGAQWDVSSLTDYWTGKMAHVAIYDHVVSVDRLEKRFRLMTGYDVAPVDSYRAMIEAENPYVYYPMNEPNRKYIIDLAHNHWAWLNEADRTMHHSQPPLVVDGGDSITFPKTASANYFYATGGIGDFPTMTTLTYELWIKPSEVVGTDHTIVCVQAAGETESGNAIMYAAINSSGEFIEIWEYGGGANETHYSGVVLEVDKIYHIVVSRDSANKTLKIWINGDETYSTTYVNDVTGGTDGRLRVGVSGGGTAQYFGDMGHLAFYDKAFDTTKVRTHYLKGIGVDNTVTDDYRDLVMSQLQAGDAYYRLDGKSSNDYGLYEETETYFNTDVENAVFDEAGQYIGKDCALLGSTANAYINDMIWTDGDAHSWAFEFWGKINNVGDRVTLCKGSTSGANDWAIYAIMEETAIRFHYYNGAGSTINVQYDFTVEKGKWYHVAGYRLSGGYAGLLVNGIPVVRTDDTNTTIRTSTLQWAINDVLHSGSTEDNGHISDLIIYKRSPPWSTYKSHYNYVHNTTVYEQLVQDSAPYYRWIMGDRLGDGRLWIDTTSSNNKHSNPSNVTVGGQPGLFKGSDGSTYYDGARNTVGYSSGSGLQSKDNFTIEGWFKQESRNSIYSSVVYSETWTTGDSGVGVYVTNAGALNIYIQNSGGSTEYFNSGHYIKLNETYHFAWVIDGSSVMCFINGRLVFTDARAGTTTPNIARKCVGQRATNDHVELKFHGYLDGIMVYHRSCTATEIKERYQAGSLDTTYEKVIKGLHPSIWLPFDTDFNDKVNDNTPVVTNATLVASDKSQGAVEFTGNGIVSYSNTVGDPGENSFTTSTWIKIPASTGDSQRIFDKKGTGSSNGWQIATTLSSPYGGGFGNTGVWVTSVGAAQFSDTDYGVFDDQWHHVLMTFDNTTGTIELWIDGVSRESVTNAALIGRNITNSRDYAVGSSVDAGTQHVTGQVDECMFFNHKLTNQEIADLYNATGVKYRMNGIVTQDLEPATRTVRVYDRLTGELIMETQSTGGDFSLDSAKFENTREYYVVALDDDVAPNLDPIVRDRIVPVDVT